VSEWERCRGWLASASTGDIEIVRSEIEAGRADFWPGEKSAAVAVLLTVLGVREYHVLIGGGELEDLKRIERSMSAYAEALGAQMFVRGRKGWLRALPGYSHAAIYVKARP